jgi:hypothetical protein
MLLSGCRRSKCPRIAQRDAKEWPALLKMCLPTQETWLLHSVCRRCEHRFEGPGIPASRSSLLLCRVLYDLLTWFFCCAEER